MPFDGTPEQWMQPSRPQKFTWVPFWVGVLAVAMYGMYQLVSTSWQYVKAPTIAMEIEKSKFFRN